MVTPVVVTLVKLVLVVIVLVVVLVVMVVIVAPVVVAVVGGNNSSVGINRITVDSNGSNRSTNGVSGSGGIHISNTENKAKHLNSFT